MLRKEQTDIKRMLKSYFTSFQKDGEPIPVNFRMLVPDLKKTEYSRHGRVRDDAVRLEGEINCFFVGRFLCNHIIFVA